jgi:DNA repair photolyase
MVRRDLDEMDAAADFRPVLLCFTCDPYPGERADNITTRNVLELFKEYNKPFQLLTKGGMKAARDFDLYKSGDAYAATLTLLNMSRSKEWEPGAPDAVDRMASLYEAKKRGIATWVSFEPVIDPEEVYSMYHATKDYVDLYKIGKMNHQESDVDWRAFGMKMVEMCERDGKKYIIKDALRKEMEA